MGQPCAVRPEVEKVRQMVFGLLAQRDKLRIEAAQISEMPVKRNGCVCGLYFAMRGPRQVLLTAIWDFDTHTLWCYDSRGNRFHTERLA